MQKRTTLFVLSFLLYLCTGHSQIASINTNGYEPFSETVTEFLPTVHPPEYSSNRNDVHFSWAMNNFPDNCEINYEFNLFHLDNNGIKTDDQPLFSIITKEPEFLLKNGMDQLISGHQYSIVIHTQLKYEEHSEKIDGEKNAFQFTYIPKCSAPEKIKVYSIGADNFEVSWSGPPATLDGINYEFRYRAMTNAGDWKRILVKEGNMVSLNGLDNSVRYEVDVKKICPEVKNEPKLHSARISEDDIQLPTAKSISLPPFICGDNHSYTQCDGPFINNITMDTLYIGDFPILVDSIWYQLTGEADSIIFGNGWVPLPFADATLRVEFGSTGKQIKINQDGHICEGEVLGVSDDPMYFPDLSPGNNPFNGQICVPPPAVPGFDSTGIHNVTGMPWDENGFGMDSLYNKQPPYPGYQPGDLIDTTGMYDPWGFDFEGNHFSGGNTNENGCTQEQMQEVPQTPPCEANPYEWLDPYGEDNAPTVEGNALAHEVEDSTEIWLELILLELEASMDDTVAIQRQACDDIRSDLDGLMNVLGYESEFIFGKDDEYYNEGMHTLFTKRPQPMSVNIDRTSEQEDLEARHIDLYDCDSSLQVIFDLSSIYTIFKVKELDSLLLEEIKRFSAAEAALYADRDSLYEWLYQRVVEMGYERYLLDYGDLGFYQPKSEQRWQQPAILEPQNPIAPSENHQNFLASNESTLNQALFESLDLSPEDVVFQFKQGWQEIDGVHRAHYLEAIEKSRTNFFYHPAMLTENDSTLMPIVVSNRASDGKVYKVYLDNIKFYQEDATLDAYIVIELPHNGQKLVFETLEVSFTPKGPQLLPLKLSLANDVPIRLSNAAKLTIKGSDNTFVAVDCNGFAGLGIEADVEICRDKVVPLDYQTLEVLPEPERVHGNFQVFMPTWSDLYVQFTADPFAINGMEDIKWRIDTMVLDFAETKSPVGLPPQGYESPFADANGFTDAWKGFYLDTLSVNLPPNWSKDSITIGAHHIVIDNMGFSGHVSANPILDLDDGNAGGWAFSIEEFSLTVIANNIENVALDGLIHVPIMSNANACSTGAAVEDDCLPYSAYVEPGGIYHFDISMPQEDFCVDMWRADSLFLDNNSSIAMQYANGEFDIVATLNGSIKVGGNLGGGISFNLPEIEFQEVEVSNKAPYFSPGTWSQPDEIGANLGGFGLTVSNLMMVETAEGDPALKIGAGVHLSSKIDMNAFGGFRIIGKLTDIDGRQRWRLKNVAVDSICFSGKSFPGVKSMAGCIHFYEEDPTFGSGFRGAVNVEFKGIDAYVQGVVQFGKKNDFKYFFVDALFCGDINMGAVKLKGLGGGIYYHMNRPESAFGLPACGTIPPVSGVIGESISGIQYTPDITKGLGLKLTVVFALANERALNANATFEILFNSPESNEVSSLSDVWVYGNGKFMEDINLNLYPGFAWDAPPINNAKFSFNVDLHLDFNEHFLHGTLEAYLNTPGLKGAGPNNRLGWAEVHLSPFDWYIKLGEPYYGTGCDKRLGVNVNVPGFSNLASFKAYFQMGENLDPMPPLPEHIAQLTGLDGSNASIALERDGLAMSGNGVVFGAEFNFGGSNYDLGIFEIDLRADLGFDASLVDYGSGVTCLNTNETLGWNGFYASLQAWIGIELGVDLKVRVFGKNRRFTILELAAAAAIQGMGPKQWYLRVGLGIEYNVLGGLVKGQFDYQKDWGEQCEVAGAASPYENVPIISMTYPEDGTTLLPTNLEPVITFNFPVEQEFSLSDFDGNEVNYFIDIDSAKIVYRGWDVPAEWTFQHSNKELRIIPGIYLPQNDSFLVVVKVHVDSNGVNVHSEEKFAAFSTNRGFHNSLYRTNIAGSYPMHGQYNFYKEEIPNHKGYIQLKKGQPEFFFEDEENILLARFRKANSDECTTKPIDYSFMDHKVTFDLPVSFFEAEEIYKMELVKIPLPTSTSKGFTINPCAPLPPTPPQNDGPIEAHHQHSIVGQEGDTGAENNNEAPQPSPPTERVLYTATFRVSQYNTFNSKMTAWKNSIGSQTLGTYAAASNFEPFDKFEMGIGTDHPPLIETQALTGNTDWFNAGIVDDMHELNPCDDILCIDRDPEILGFPAERATYFLGSSDKPPTITTSVYSDGGINIGNNDYIQRFKYGATHIADADFINFKQDIAMEIYNYENSLEIMDVIVSYSSNPNIGLCEFYDLYGITQGLTMIAPGHYYKILCTDELPQEYNNFPVLFRYRLPGTNQYGSEKQVNLTF